MGDEVVGEVEATAAAVKAAFFGGRTAQLAGEGDYVPPKEVKPLRRVEISPEQMKQERREARVQRKQAREVRASEVEEDEEIVRPFSKVAKVERMTEGIFDPDKAQKRVLKDRKDFLKGTEEEILKRETKEMLLLLMAMITGENIKDELRADLVKDWLDRAGIVKVLKIEAGVSALSDKELAELRDKAKKSKELQDKKPNQLVLTGDGEAPENA